MYKFNKTPGKVTTYSPSRKMDLSSIPWEICRTVYIQAADAAEDTLRQEYEERTSQIVSAIESQWLAENPEAGSYEGNPSDNLLVPEMPDVEPYRNSAGNDAIASGFITPYGLIDYVDSFMPQLITMLAGFTLHKNENGLISGLKFRNQNFTTPELKGIYRFLMLDSRSSYLKTQYKGTNKNYCSLVPLIMYAHKLVHRVPYSAWDPEEIQYVVNPQLVDAMLFTPAIPFTPKELLAERTMGLLIRSGDKAGTSASPVWKHRLTGPQLKTGLFKDVPYLAQVMYSQIWCAHPDNRTSYMILDPQDWNKVPVPLVDTTVISTTATFKPSARRIVSDDWSS